MFSSPGSVHDFKIYKESIGSAAAIVLKADSGYQGLAAYHGKSEVPTKRSKYRPLTAEEKLTNRRLSSERVLIEHINRRIKILKIMSYPYRNRRKRPQLRLSLICAILNSEKEKEKV